MIKVCLLSDQHLSINPRVWKEAFFFEKKGYEVVILTMWYSKEFLARDKILLKGHNIRYESFLDFTSTKISPLKKLAYRLRRKLALQLVKFGIEAAPVIGYSPRSMIKAALNEKADLYVAHLECAFYAGVKLIEKGKKVAFDFEDWYSRDYVSKTRPIRFLEEIERKALTRGLYCTAASLSMAQALKYAYQSKNEPTVIYNGFSCREKTQSDTPTTSSKSIPKLVWFSRNIGENRGIETLMEALKMLKTPVELHLMGLLDQADYIEKLKGQFSQIDLHQLFIHDFMDHDKLVSFLAQFDVGLAIEDSVVDSRRLTVTNKILQYMQASIKVLATDTKGQREVADMFPEAVKLVEIGKVDSWGSILDGLLASQHDKKHQESIFESMFSWEAQEKKIEQLLKGYLAC